MRFHIDTIPVWDAYKTDSECPICNLRRQSEDSYLAYFVGGSVMEPDERVRVNDIGFCVDHLAKLLALQQRLPLALMVHTHMMALIDRMKPPEPLKKHRMPFGKRSHEPEPGRCILCDRLNETMERYVYTAVHLWKTDAEFRVVFERSKGLCMPHYVRLLQMAEQAMSAACFKDFCGILFALQRENMRRVEKDLFGFTQKFDYRNRETPWGNSKDALERAICKLRGK
ncbi:MAG: DUF6062 family protein [Clostridia bacterium]|nr:DUF6062 family protein [Clostridia bacterium]